MNVLIKTVNGSVSLLIYIPGNEKEWTTSKIYTNSVYVIVLLHTIPFTFPYSLMQYETISELLYITRVANSTCEIEQFNYAEYLDRSKWSMSWRLWKLMQKSRINASMLGYAKYAVHLK